MSELGEPTGEPIWLEPYPSGNPECRYEKIENIGIAFTAALQHLPASQRAVLILREVLRFSAAETADLLGTSVAAVNSSLQRARRIVGDGLPEPTSARDDLVAAFAAAWERADVAAMVALLAKDARFSMPPLPAWFDGRGDVLRFMAERMWPDGPWRLVPAEAGGQPAFDFDTSFTAASVRERAVYNYREIEGIDPRMLPERGRHVLVPPPRRILSYRSAYEPTALSPT